ncbi:hypothetical protein [Natrinema longum]|uniref:Uncharacterized protein n=1 Tax=Natrinema longum TaxID=370324 RepID=A0A8A2UA51_9EURY|nr:hypothetical protein [Natrinema longum]MBZ6496530.1 hypothetical protein [Natrinema longum]QSW85566.1 hypothetical protein J0X27_01605 [Natrinema longum]
MTTPLTIDRYKENAVPLTLFLITAVAVLIVPPIVEGELGVYGAVWIVIVIAFVTVFPYACVVAVGTLPLLYADIASFAAPDTDADAFHSFSWNAALRHVVAGFSYVVGAAIVGAIGIGTQMTVLVDYTILDGFHPSFLIGSMIVAVAFVRAQLWRYDRPLRTLPLRTVFGTLVLGGLLALSIVAAFWVFNDAPAYL